MFSDGFQRSCCDTLNCKVGNQEIVPMTDDGHVKTVRENYLKRGSGDSILDSFLTKVRNHPLMPRAHSGFPSILQRGKIHVNSNTEFSKKSKSSNMQIEEHPSKTSLTMHCDAKNSNFVPNKIFSGALRRENKQLTSGLEASHLGLIKNKQFKRLERSFTNQMMVKKSQGDDCSPKNIVENQSTDVSDIQRKTNLKKYNSSALINDKFNLKKSEIFHENFKPGEQFIKESISDEKMLVKYEKNTKISGIHKHQMSTIVTEEPLTATSKRSSRQSKLSITRNNKQNNLMEQPESYSNKIKIDQVFLKSSSFTSREQLLRSRHDCDIDNLQCLQCHTNFTSIKTLYFHMVSIHAVNRLHYSCPLCGVTFVQLWGVSRHLKSVHHKTKDQITILKGIARSTAAFKSDTVTQEYQHKKSASKSETRLHAIADYKRLECTICKRQFSTASNLRRHAANHLGWARYRCALCDYKAFNRSDCRSHIARKHVADYRADSYIISSNSSFTRNGNNTTEKHK